MGKAKRFKLSRKLLRILRRFFHRKRRAQVISHRRSGILRKIWSLGRWLRHHQPWRIICQGNRKSDNYYFRLGQVETDDTDSDPVTDVPKGCLAVYVGEEKDDDTCRMLVPVIYFNHPLFAGLLTTAENVYGFEYGGGGIQIPCRKSEFEDVKNRIAATKGRW